MTSPATIVRILIGLALFALAGPATAQDPATALINQKLAEKWKEHKLQPADKTSDAEFLRRASLDLIGRIPSVAELQAFEKDAAADKRARLIDKLLASPEHARYWATLWTNWLTPPPYHSTYRAQLHLWLEEYLTRPKQSYKDKVTALLAGAGKTNEEGRVHFVLAGAGQPLAKAGWPQAGRFDAVPLTSRTLRLFLGYRLSYDLPEKSDDHDWRPAHFWSVNAFFRQVDVAGDLPAATEPKSLKAALVLELTDNPSFNKDGKIAYPAADGKNAETEPVFLDGRKIPAGWKGTRRQALAELLTSHPNFARAQVNRVWGELFGRGLHERPVVDDFGSKHQIVHPELLDGLAKEFGQSNYDTRKLLRAICLSDAYQLKSTTNASNAKPELEVYFSRMPLRVLRPEQLIESVVVALQPRDAQRARQLMLRSPPLVANGPDWDDRQLHEKIIYSVALLNRRELQDLLTSKVSQTLADALKRKSGKESFSAVCLAVLGRPASGDEYDRIARALPIKGEKDPLTEAPLQDVLWALLNSSEFILNH